MREVKYGDRCESELMDAETVRVQRCDVHHLTGKPPKALLPCIKGTKTVFLCAEHAKNFPLVGSRKRQKRSAVQVEQIDLVALAAATYPDPKPLADAMVKHMELTCFMEMPEGI